MSTLIQLSEIHNRKCKRGKSRNQAKIIIFRLLMEAKYEETKTSLISVKLTLLQVIKQPEVRLGKKMDLNLFIKLRISQ